MYLRIGATILSLLVVGLMVLDQWRLNRMRGKWALVPLMLAITVGPAWIK